jgi:hypothetical protein
MLFQQIRSGRDAAAYPALSARLHIVPNRRADRWPGSARNQSTVHNALVKIGGEGLGYSQPD